MSWYPALVRRETSAVSDEARGFLDPALFGKGNNNLGPSRSDYGSPFYSTPRSTWRAELTARVLSAVSDEFARLMLSDPDRFPPERLLDHARWMLGRGASERRRTSDD